MSQPFVGEIRMFAGTFAPANWAFCSGQTIAISQNSVLFALIGTTYGGNGVSTFQLPNLQSRLPVHMGTGPGLSTYVIGQPGGSEAVQLAANQLPSHSHAVMASANIGNMAGPSNAVPATPASTTVTPTLYVVPGTSTITPTAMSSTIIAPVGGGQPHSNIMPYLVVNFIISLFGIFPSRN